MKAKQGGFTLIELMFTILVLAVLLAIGVPNFRDFLRNSRMVSQANDLLTGVNLARSEAVKRRSPVTLCAGTTAACNGDFADGWFVFVDTDGDGVVDATEEVLRRHDAMPDGFGTAVYQSGDTEDSATPTYVASATRYVSFGPNGFRRMSDGTLPVAIGLVVCDARGNVPAGSDMSAARALELSTSGRAAVTRSIARIDTLGDCP